MSKVYTNYIISASDAKESLREKYVPDERIQKSNYKDDPSLLDKSHINYHLDQMDEMIHIEKEKGHRSITYEYEYNISTWFDKKLDDDEIGEILKNKGYVVTNECHDINQCPDDQFDCCGYTMIVKFKISW